jgi:hypothetical protein
MDYVTQYEAEERLGLRGEHTLQVYRMRSTALHVPANAKTLLDVGAGEGHWLNFIGNRLAHTHLSGVEVSQSRTSAARARYPTLDIVQDDVFEMDIDERYDVVTCLEVIEHLEEWRCAVERLVELAERRVVITVPYREDIPQYVCVHCQRATPRYGHLHRFDESSLDFMRERYPMSVHRIWGETPNLWLKNLYYRFVAPPSWLVFVLHVDGSPARPERGLAAWLTEFSDRCMGMLPRSFLA